MAAIPLEMLTILPHPAAVMPGISIELRVIGATTLTITAVATAAGSRDAVGPSGATTAALLTNTTGGPSSSPTRSTPPRSFSMSCTSLTTAVAIPPASWISATASPSSLSVRASSAT